MFVERQGFAPRYEVNTCCTTHFNLKKPMHVYTSISIMKQLQSLLGLLLVLHPPALLQCECEQVSSLHT